MERNARRGGMIMEIEKVILDIIKDYCKEEGYSTKMESLLKKIVSNYRNQGSIDESDLNGFIERIQKQLGKENKEANA